MGQQFNDTLNQDGQNRLTSARVERGEWITDVKLKGNNIEQVILDKDNPMAPRSAGDYQPRDTSEINHYIPHISTFSATPEILGVYEQSILVVSTLNASVNIKIGYSFYRNDLGSIVGTVGNNVFFANEVTLPAGDSAKSYVIFMPEKGVSSVTNEDGKQVVEVPELRSALNLFSLAIKPTSTPSAGEIAILSTRRY